MKGENRRMERIKLMKICKDEQEGRNAKIEANDEVNEELGMAKKNEWNDRTEEWVKDMNKDRTE